MNAGLIQAGLKIGHDIDLVTKQSTQLTELLRPKIIFFHEDFRAAGRDLANSVMAWIDALVLLDCNWSWTPKFVRS